MAQRVYRHNLAGLAPAAAASNFAGSLPRGVLRSVDIEFASAIVGQGVFNVMLLGQDNREVARLALRTMSGGEKGAHFRCDYPLTGTDYSVVWTVGNTGAVGFPAGTVRIVVDDDPNAPVGAGYSESYT